MSHNITSKGQKVVIWTQKIQIIYKKKECIVVEFVIDLNTYACIIKGLDEALKAIKARSGSLNASAGSFSAPANPPP